MNKYIICLVSILCLALTSMAYAGKNVMTSFSGELVSVSLIDKNGKEIIVPGGSGHIGLNNELDITASVGEGKTLPAGEYKALKYVFKNDFSVSGKVVLDNGDEYGILPNNGGLPQFKKGYAPGVYQYKYAEESAKNWEWCTTSVKNGQLEVIQNEAFTLDENSEKTFRVYIVLKWLWFGRNWDNFNESSSITPTGGEEIFKRIKADIIEAPFIDPPEMAKEY